MIEIENSEAVTGILGRWPTFHDAEILSLCLERSPEPTLTAKIHAWDMTPEVDPKGLFLLKNHTVVTLCFHGVLLELIKTFNRQNVISELIIQELDGTEPPLDYFPSDEEGVRYRVAFEPSYGCLAMFRCRRIEVVSAEPFTPASR